MNMMDSNPVDLVKLKALIHDGMQAIPPDKENNAAVIVIGDTGVGKSTILSFLAGSQLVVKFDGLKPTLDNPNSTQIKIGHEKYSQTSIPTKVVIEKLAFYDCPGFKDNKGEEYEISNSFFVQRLLDIYQKVKIVLIVDESHISEARADKLPKLIRNLHKSFTTFQDIRDGVCMIINRASADLRLEDYYKEIKKMILLKNENGYLFRQQERQFLDFLIFRNRILLFKQAGKEQRDQKFAASQNEKSILQSIKDCQYVRSKHIQNILSQSAKLSIRDFIDEITNRSNTKIEIICSQIIDIYQQKVLILGRNVEGIIKLKDSIIKLAQEMKACKQEHILSILQRELPPQKIQDFEEDFASILFFRAIYDKTSTYFSNLINKIYSELSRLLTKLDKRITVIQKEEIAIVQKKKEEMEFMKKKEVREQEKVVAIQHCSKMNGLKGIAMSLITNKLSLIERIKESLRNLSSVEDQLRKAKSDAIMLDKLGKEVSYEFERIEVTYFKSAMK